MNKLLIIAAICCATVAAWLLQQSGQPATLADASPPPAVTEPTNARGVSLTPETATTSDDETEIVLGLRVRKDRNCTVELNDYVTTDGEMFSAYTCVPSRQSAEHPYAQYTDGALRELSFADADAAAQLGRRLVHKDREQSYTLLLRATALDGDVRHLAWLADAAYGRYRVDGELQVDNVMRQYELAALSAHFGGDPSTSNYLREELLNSGVSQDQLIQLDRRVDDLLRIASNIQRNVYGEVRHGGQPDA